MTFDTLLAADGPLVRTLVPIIVCVIAAFVLAWLLRVLGGRLLDDRAEVNSLAKATLVGVSAVGFLLGLGRLVDPVATDTGLQAAMSGMIGALPGLTISFILVIVALLVAAVLRATVTRVVATVRPAMARAAGAVVYWAIVVLVSLIAAEQAGMDVGVLRQLLIITFSITFPILPASGSDSWRHFVLPTIVLGYFAMPAIMRLTRSGMIAALETMPGVYNIEDNLKPGPSEARLVVDAQRAAQHELSFEEIAIALRGANDGIVASSFRRCSGSESSNGSGSPNSKVSSTRRPSPLVWTFAARRALSIGRFFTISASTPGLSSLRRVVHTDPSSLTTVRSSARSADCAATMARR